jgi:NAD(P)H-dependent flavin oxidoreductase YrpB (nitropropane dioxygenase family)
LIRFEIDEAKVAMGTRFLLSAESPVPKITTDRYLAASVDDVLVTKQIDGLPQRVVRNELVDESVDELVRIFAATASVLLRHEIAYALSQMQLARAERNRMAALERRAALVGRAGAADAAMFAKNITDYFAELIRSG